ncbi:MAG: hypothetical protein IJJ26_00845 [Victivallales bacterium]|nr:hypothetical protein [Victivallales bacterium]
MNQFLTALQAVSRLKLDWNSGSEDRPSTWLRVLLRGLLGLVWGLVGGLVLWLVPGDRAVGTLLATLAVIGVRVGLSHPNEKYAFEQLSGDLAPKDADGSPNPYFRQAVFNLLLFVRPLCIYFILLHYNFLWLCAAAALGMAIAIDEEVEPDKRQPLGGNWVAAFAVTLGCGALGSKIFPNQAGMFIISVIAIILCWLLPYMLDRVCAKRTTSSMLLLGETAALILGLLGQAL